MISRYCRRIYFSLAAIAIHGTLSTLVPCVASAGQQWAVLIGCEQYQQANPLKFTVNDVKQLASTLELRGGYEKSHLLLMTDDENEVKHQPLRASILRELPVFLDKIAPGDSVFVYFTGHGFRDGDGKLYLAPLDIDPANPAKTGIAVEWLRERIANCRGDFKLLVLDACHAGSEKGEEDMSATSVTSKDLQSFFQNLEGVVTIASSTAAEPSQIWDAKEQSLFSYWLNQGLKGHADDDANGAVNIDELYNFVHRNVLRTSKDRFPRTQTPVRIVRSGAPGVPTIVRLNPHTLREALSDIAETLADRIDERRQGRVGVLEFINESTMGDLLGANYGALGKWCTDEFERRLLNASMERFSIVDQRRLQHILKSEGFQLDDLYSGERLQQLSKQAGGMPVLAIGTLRNRAGRAVMIQCKLQSVESDETIASASATALLNEDEWAMLGRSVKIEPRDRVPEIPVSADAPPADPIATVIDRADERSQGAHPLQDAKFDFPIKIVVNGKERPFVFKSVGEGEETHTECFVGLKKDEVYEIWVGNRIGTAVKMRLLVDGCNTMPEKEDLKGITTKIVGKRVNLDEAAGWVLEPAKIKPRRDGSYVWAIRGFFEEVGAQGSLRKFTVDEADNSLAARQKFTDQIGIITAAFYTALPPGNRSRGGLGTRAGDRQAERTQRSDLEFGDLLSVVHIRYVDVDALK
ncbi:Caspase domain protein [Posidoniimonas polymericola]|uniref:Caspase domain protein n=1 Tax=Posidoniimonas polymericola TaxID=2528002 RepID=A0A5C5XX76_9BACT|nr:caspase family protein [Posidoniimonas polymericola]TWT66953.1 Caspase domain protein [Posidoniimonas polymericola]